MWNKLNSLTNKLTNGQVSGKILSWEPNSCSASQILYLLWNLTVHYHVDRSQPLVPILIHINSVHTLLSCLIYTSVFQVQTSWLKFWIHFSNLTCILHVPGRIILDLMMMMMIMIIIIIAELILCNLKLIAKSN